MNDVTLQYSSQMAPSWNSYSSLMWRAFAVHDPVHRRVAVNVGGGHRGSALWQQRARVRDGASHSEGFGKLATPDKNKVPPFHHPFFRPDDVGLGDGAR